MTEKTPSAKPDFDRASQPQETESEQQSGDKERFEEIKASFVHKDNELKLDLSL